MHQSFPIEWQCGLHFKNAGQGGGQHYTILSIIHHANCCLRHHLVCPWARLYQPRWRKSISIDRTNWLLYLCIQNINWWFRCRSIQREIIFAAMHTMGILVHLSFHKYYRILEFPNRSDRWCLRGSHIYEDWINLLRQSKATGRNIECIWSSQKYQALLQFANYSSKLNWARQPRLVRYSQRAERFDGQQVLLGRLKCHKLDKCDRESTVRSAVLI